MKLLWSPKSPFVRKVMIVMHELGIAEHVELVRVVAAPRGEPNPAIMTENPLGKIPTLLVPGLPPIFDSAVICDWLSMQAGDDRILPRAGEARLAQLRWQVLGDGLINNLLLWRVTRQSEDGGDEQAILSYRAKVRAVMACLEHEADRLAAGPFGVGQITVLCALGQLDFRFVDSDWRAAHPRLAAWEAALAPRPSVSSTAIVNDQVADVGPHIDLTFRKD